MRQIMKAQLYQLQKNRLPAIVFILLLFIQCTQMLGESDFMNGQSPGALIAAGDYVAGNGIYVTLYALVFALFFTAYVCGVDFVDKTTNYELMSGHERKDVYFGRAVLSIIGGTVGTMLLCAFPVLVGSIAGEWGDSISFLDVLVRYLLSFFPIARIVCEFVCLTFFVKNAYIVMAVGVVVPLYGGMLPAMFTEGTASFLGVTSVAKLYDFSSWGTYTLVGEKNIVIYDAAMKAGEVVPVILASIIFGGLFLMLGYWFFKKDDLN